MALAFLLGRIIVGLYWLQVAYNHLKNAGALAGYTQSKGIKSAGMAKTAVIVSGVLALVGGLSVLLGVYPVWGVAALVAFLLGVSFRMHAYWTVQDPSAKMGETINFKKNLALLGATLMFLAISTPWVYSLGW